MNDSEVIIVGVGDAGCQVIDHLTGYGLGNAVIAAINTDSKALAVSKAAVKLQIGVGLTDGLGAGGDVELGRKAAENDMVMIRNLFSGVKLVFIVAGFGGGTGTGAVPVVLDAAAEAGAVTLCFAILPFKFEGRNRRVQADRAVTDLSKAGNTLIIIPNDRLAESVGKANAAETFEKSDQVISAGISSIEQAIVKPGLMNLNFSDLRKVIKDSGGICTFGYGIGEGKNKTREAIASLLDNSLLERGAVISKAGSLMVSIAGGVDLTLKEINDIMGSVSSKVAHDTDVLMGTVVNEEWHDKVMVTVVAADKLPVVSAGENAGANEKAAVSSRHGQMQTRFELTLSSKGRFKDVEPTVQNGEDLDIPTYIRRGISIEK